MVPLHLKELAAFCRESGIHRFYGSPGSRSAPILLSLLRTGNVEVEMAGDERSAAYKALGYSLGTGKPCGVFCTSGTASLNLSPAIAEAFYQYVPLFVLTADRPPELIDQQEGQAIRQNGLFEKHTRYSAQLPAFDMHPSAIGHARRICNEAFYACTGPLPGPVHLNIPVREPFYPEENEDFTVLGSLLVQSKRSDFRLARQELSNLIEEWNLAPRRLLLAGQLSEDYNLSNACKALSEYAFCPVVGDALSNFELHPGSVRHPDLLNENFLTCGETTADILITIGNGFVSKKIKKYLSKNRPQQHWHIQEAGYPADAFGTLTKVINASPEWLVTKLAEASCFSPDVNKEASQKWLNSWIFQEKEILRKISQFGPAAGWSDLFVVDFFSREIPEHSILFVGNSMPVRYITWLFPNRSDLTIFCNRGTSGIDGCLSAAFGIAMARPEKQVFIVLGDMSFLYDRNAFWTDRIPTNLKVLVLNNSGGNIFRMLPAAAVLPELEQYFEISQHQTTAGTCADAGVKRFEANSAQSLLQVFQDWKGFESCAVLEVFTDKSENQIILKEFKILFENAGK